MGDIAPSDNVTKEVKNQLETEAMHKIRDMLGTDSAAGRSHAHAFIYWGHDQHRKWQSLQLVECPLHHLVDSNTCTVIQCDTTKQSYEKSVFRAGD